MKKIEHFLPSIFLDNSYKCEINPDTFCRSTEHENYILGEWTLRETWGTELRFVLENKLTIF